MAFVLVTFFAIQQCGITAKAVRLAAGKPDFVVTGNGSGPEREFWFYKHAQITVVHNNVTNVHFSL